MLDPNSAVPISNFSIALSSIIRYIMNSKLPHPLKNGKGVLVDYNYAIIMFPAIISGVSVGGIATSYMPATVVNYSLVLTSMCIAISLLIKLLGIRKQENAEKLAKATEEKP